MSRRVCLRVAAVVGAMAPTPAEAHLATTRFGDFYGGVLHLGTALEHVLALLALGLLAGLQDPRDGRWILVAAPLGLLAGGSVAIMLPQGTPAPAVGMALLTLLGLLAALARPVPALPLAAAGLLVGLLHGYQNDLAASDASIASLFILGVVACGLVGLTLIAATAVATRQRAAWGVIALRAGGSWIAAIGVMMLGFGLV